MRSLLVGAALLICVPAQAQENSESELLLERLNEAVEDAQSADQAVPAPMPSDPEGQAQPAPMPSEPDDAPDVAVVPMDEPTETRFADLPNWGVVVRDQSGAVVEIFGQVDYEVVERWNCEGARI